MHTHHCKVCNTVVASCSDERCVNDVDNVTVHYCSIHHPDEKYRAEDKPTVRMTVGIDPEQVLGIKIHD